MSAASLSDQVPAFGAASLAATAVELAGVIRHVNKHTRKLGAWASKELAFAAEHGLDEPQRADDPKKRSEAQSVRGDLEAVQKAAEVLQRAELCTAHSSDAVEAQALNVEVLGERLEGAASEEQMARWYAHAAARVSGFGDVRAGETVVDAQVRNARELLPEHVAPALVQAVERFWAAHFYPTCVRAEFYKLNLYAPGGKFAPHLDTPQRDLLGTVLVCLGDSTREYRTPEHAKPARPRRARNDSQKAPKRARETFPRERKWDHHDLYVQGEGLELDAGDVCGFFTDVPHAVNTVPCGHRATLAFKIFYRAPGAGTAPRAPSDAREAARAQVRQALREALGACQPGFALLLSHRYARQDAAMKGRDQLLVEALRALPGGRVLLFPVAVKYRATWYEGADGDGDNECASSVYALTDSVVRRALLQRRSAEQEAQDVEQEEQDDEEQEQEREGDDAPPLPADADEVETLRGLRFYDLEGGENRAGYCWQHSSEQAEEYTGNECRPGDENSLYVNFAAVLAKL